MCAGYYHKKILIIFGVVFQNTNFNSKYTATKIHIMKYYNGFQNFAELMKSFNTETSITTFRKLCEILMLIESTFLKFMK